MEVFKLKATIRPMFQKDNSIAYMKDTLRVVRVKDEFGEA